MHHIPMTLSGAKKLKKELEYLKNIKRTEIIESIAEARKNGDLRENAEYHAAKEQQSFCEGRIKILETKLSYAYIIDISNFSPSNKVIFGSTVKVKKINFNDIDVDENIKIYRIVGEDEADLKNQLISINSPIARGLIGKWVGEIVDIKTPSGIIQYEIINVDYI